MTIVREFPYFERSAETRNTSQRSGFPGGFRPRLTSALAVALVSLSLGRPLST